MKKNKFALFIAVIIFAHFSFFAQTNVKGTAVNGDSASTSGSGKIFTFKYKKDDRYRILSRVNEDVLINNQLDHHSEIVSRVSVHIESVKAGGKGVHKANFMTSDTSTAGENGKHLTWNEEYNSEYERDAQGRFTIDAEYFMPVIRDMPVFPQKPIFPGETWTEEGYEAHDLRRTFNIKQPLKVPFNAVYVYEGEKSVDSGKKFDVFTVTYNLYFDSPSPENKEGLYSEYPVTTTGYSQQKLYWDYDRGALDHYTETFRITIVTSHGNVFKFNGTTEAEITQFERTSDDLDKVKEKIENLNLKDVQVKNNEKGITISLENIQFKADSAVLQDSEKEKLKKIAVILKEYPNNDLLISGYTALAGTMKSRLKLSKERAEAVADYLAEIGVKDLYHIFTKGFGAQNPVAPNNTDEGRSRNRRVEITILDK
ncbi:OmpA family protein [Treponema parvum]|uniref:OmpA family protein n=1 Tax=Treponema parvum TaxID=138851 RepID=UPI001AEBDB2C|nr:OmpA family protein [Treponema parvum]QTQ15650.1 OmpA family protein [Treponema parvum]